MRSAPSSSQYFSYKDKNVKNSLQLRVLSIRKCSRRLTHHTNNALGFHTPRNLPVNSRPLPNSPTKKRQGKPAKITTTTFRSDYPREISTRHDLQLPQNSTGKRNIKPPPYPNARRKLPSQRTRRERPTSCRLCSGLDWTTRSSPRVPATRVTMLVIKELLVSTNIT
jgi:hypothetical protein